MKWRREKATQQTNNKDFSSRRNKETRVSQKRRYNSIISRPLGHLSSQNWINFQKKFKRPLSPPFPPPSFWKTMLRLFREIQKFCNDLFWIGNPRWLSWTLFIKEFLTHNHSVEADSRSGTSLDSWQSSDEVLTRFRRGLDVPTTGRLRLFPTSSQNVISFSNLLAVTFHHLDESFSLPRVETQMSWIRHRLQSSEHTNPKDLKALSVVWHQWCQFQVYLSATSFYALLDNCQQCRLCTLSMSSSALWCPGLNEEEVVERNRIPKICQRFFFIFEKFRVIRTDTNVWGNC